MTWFDEINLLELVVPSVTSSYGPNNDSSALSRVMMKPVFYRHTKT